MRKPVSRAAGLEVHTSAQLAATLGLSRWSVSRALNGRTGVSQETVQRVRQASREHHFEPDPLARGLRGGCTGMVGVCVPVFSSQPMQYGYDDSTLRGLGSMDRRLRELGYLPVLEAVCGHPDKEWDAVKRLLAMRVQAVMMIGPHSSADGPIFKAVKDKGLPAIIIAPKDIPPLTTARVDEKQAALLLVRHLHDLGHRKCAVLGFGVGERHLQLAAALRQYSIESQTLADRSDDGRVGGRPGHEVARGHALVGRMLAKTLSASVIIAANDRLALGAIRSLNENALRVPQDCSVAGYGNTELAESSLPALTSVDLQTDKLIERSTDLLCDQLRSPGRFETTELLVNPVLVHRDSVGTPRINTDHGARPV